MQSFYKSIIRATFVFLLYQTYGFADNKPSCPVDRPNFSICICDASDSYAWSVYPPMYNYKNNIGYSWYQYVKTSLGQAGDKNGLTSMPEFHTCKIISLEPANATYMKDIIVTLLPAIYKKSIELSQEELKTDHIEVGVECSFEPDPYFGNDERQEYRRCVIKYHINKVKDILESAY